MTGLQIWLVYGVGFILIYHQTDSLSEEARAISLMSAAS